MEEVVWCIKRKLVLTEKTPAFPVINAVTPDAKSIDSEIRSRIFGHVRGWMFTPKQSKYLGSSAAIDSALRRLVAEGTIGRLSRGL
jgi:hypothetical protein